MAYGDLPDSDDFEALIAAPKDLTKLAGMAKPFMEPCRKCHGSGRFTSFSGRTVGPCYACKGQGQLSYKTSADDRAQNRAKAAERKARGAAAYLEDFAAKHPAEWSWIEGSRGSFEFAQSMHDAIAKFGDLTERQLAACANAAAKLAQRKAEREAQRTAAVAAAPVIDMTKIEAAFGNALASGLKAPKLRIGSLVISPAKATSTNAGALYIKSRGSYENSTYFGKILGGKFIKSRDCDAATEALILKTAEDPLAAAIAYGRETGTCSCCGAELTNKISIELGIGPICRGRWGL